MNLILFSTNEINRPLPRSDRRAIHVLDVLRRQAGDSFDAGLINGPRGTASIAAIGADALTLAFTWGPPPPPADPITLIVGLPRPQTARDILRDATSLGVRALHFIRTDKSERSYAQSTLWTSGEWQRHVITGAEQAFDTRIPDITHSRTLDEVTSALSLANELGREVTRIALDNYESPAPLSKYHLSGDTSLVLALGSERGWSAAERGALRAHGFAFAHLGARVLRTETAVIAALAIARAKLGLM